MKYPEKQIIFLYGNEENKLNEYRLNLVNHFLSKEEREENYIEFSPKPSRKKQSLDEIMPDLLAELGTVSFFPDSKRVVVVYNLAELYGSPPKSKSEKKSKEDSKPKTSREGYFIKYLEDQLLKSQNILIMVNVEDLDENLRVSEKSNLFKALVKLGFVHKKGFSSRSLYWELEDAARGRNLLKSLEIIRDWLAKNEGSARRNIFNIFLKQIILMLQAKVKSKETHASSDTRQSLFPDNLKYNLFKERDFVKEKVMRGQINYRVSELTNALEKLVKINIILYPQTTDLYVPDFQMVIEHFCVEFMKPKNTI